MLFSTTTLAFLLVTCIPSTFTAPLPDENNAFNLDRRLPALGDRKASAKPPASTPKTVQPPTSKTKAATTAKVTTSAATKVTSLTHTTTATTQRTATSSISATITTPSVCALPKSTVTPPKPGPKRFALGDLLRFVRRDDPEFIGWHGTNANTAQLWASRGEVVKPTNDDGTVTGNAGAMSDAELGPGLYLTDNLGMAEVAAVRNGGINKVPGKVCAIFAKSSTNWRQNVIKTRIPEILRGNGDKFEQSRLAYIPAILQARLGLNAQQIKDILIPEPLNPTLSATCFDVDTTGNIQNRDPAIPEINYFSDDLLEKWKIVPEDNVIATSAKAAIRNKCGEF